MVDRDYSSLPEISASIIGELSSDYYTIRRIAEGSNGLSVIVFPFEGYESRRLAPLKPVQSNIIELDLSRLPLSDEDIDFIAACSSLEKLEIDGTPVNSSQFQKFTSLQHLKMLKAQTTSLTDESVMTLKQMAGLKDLFVWGTGLTGKAIQELKRNNSKLNINAGIDPDINFTSTLPSPEIEPEKVFFIDPFRIRFQHPLEGIDIYYTIDGSVPDRQSLKFSGDIPVNESMLIKFQAYREGWNASTADSTRFFRSSEAPDQSYLTHSPDKKYMGRKEQSLFDLEKGGFNLRDSTWLGFQKDIFELKALWNDPVLFKEILLSSFINTGIHVFPPSRVEIFGGNSDNDVKLLYKKNFPVLEKEQGSSFNFISCPLDSESSIRTLIIKVVPLAKLPVWHAEKGKPGWFFIDEVVLVE
jgi:hypothetical protein